MLQARQDASIAAERERAAAADTALAESRKQKRQCASLY